MASRNSTQTVRSNPVLWKTRQSGRGYGAGGPVREPCPPKCAFDQARIGAP